MLNRDINSRFEDWLLSPIETLDFEVKQWLDLSEVEAQGLVAKALIALENHGGGFLLFGYCEDENKKLTPDQKRPASLEPYLSDNINAIIKRRAEPSFHADVTLQRHPNTREEYPLVRVTGSSTVPVRSDSSTPKGALKDNVYYIRASGPESRAPLNGQEWDLLLRRVLLKQREEIVTILRAFYSSASDLVGQVPTTKKSVLDDFVVKSVDRWRSLNETLDGKSPAYIRLGYYHFGARLIGIDKNIDPIELIRANESARRYTGWPVFLTLHHEKTRPKLVEGAIEAWLAHSSIPDVGHADFWRISPKGNFFLLRGYQEDSLDTERGFGTPGALFEATLPIWRLAEFLLRVLEVGSAMFESGFDVAVSCEWHGLRDRVLFFHNKRRVLTGHYQSAQDHVKTEGQFSESMIRDLLPDVVRTLTKILYEYFDFFTPPDSIYREELEEMQKNRY